MSYFFIGTRPINDTMKMAKVIDQAIDPSSARLLESAQRQLDALRGAIDARLVELESALADPSRAAALTSLMTELARLATTEA
jgi:16S rRNA C1402 N4-methylase RsmH